MSTSGGRSTPADAARSAMAHEAVYPLPRGELFLADDFLERFFGAGGSDYAGRVAAAARALGLSLVGVDLNGGLASPFFHSKGGALSGYFLVGYMNGPVSRLIERWGFMEAMLSLHKEPRLFRDVGEKLVKQAEVIACQARERGCSAVAVADDIAGTQGLLFSPAWFAEAALPVYRDIAGALQINGLRAFFHSDGDTRKIIGPLAGAGYACIHPVDAQAGLDLHSLAEEFGSNVCFMGHIDIAGWNAARIATEVERAESAFRHGGLIIGSSCGVSLNTADGLSALYPGWRSGTT